MTRPSSNAETDSFLVEHYAAVDGEKDSAGAHFLSELRAAHHSPEAVCGLPVCRTYMHQSLRSVLVFFLPQKKRRDHERKKNIGPVSPQAKIVLRAKKS